METSDSECFESADEDFLSDKELTSAVRNIKKTEETCTKNEKNAVEFSNKNDKSNLGNKTDNVSSDVNRNVTAKQVPQANCEKTPQNKALNYEKEKDIDNVSKISDISSNDEDILKTEKIKPKLGKKLGSKLKREVCGPAQIINLEKKIGIINLSETSAEESQTNIERENMLSEGKLNLESKEGKKDEENLWDDNELDWGKEESLNKQEEDRSTTKKSALDEENMWEDDDWEPVEPPQNTTSNKISSSTDNTASSWANWGSWGVSSIINTATQSVSTLTNHVSQGFTTVLETGIGIPDPEEMALINKTQKEKIQERLKDQELQSNEIEELQSKQTENEFHSPTPFGLGNFVSGVSHITKLVESTGTKVISGGLDTLETIGKKTMEVLQEGDPGFKKKRAFLKLDQDKPVLSHVLREAKEKAEQENKLLKEKHFASKTKNYETLFDDHQGLVHLEALEMLSRQCDIKLQTLSESYSGDTLVEMKETMAQVKELCELPDEDEEEQLTISFIKEKLESAISEINITISYNKLFILLDDTDSWLNDLNLDVCDERELHQEAIDTLARVTAIAVEQFHKTGELLLVKDHRSTADEADSLVQLTTSLTSLVGLVAGKFSEKLNAKVKDSCSKETVNNLITNVFYEAANSSSYIQDAFQLLIPVLQVGAV